jgi:hypothetical protein
MIQRVYQVVEVLYGRSTIIYASTDEAERDAWFDNHPGISDAGRMIYKVRYNVDLDAKARMIWDNLDALERLSLERVDCAIWLEKAQSKHST